MLRRIRSFLFLVMSAAFLAVFAVYAISEIGPEVVTVETFAKNGQAIPTRLWVVDAAGHPWLRASVDGSEWLRRLEAQPRVIMHRVTDVREFTAVPVRDDAAVDKVETLMRSKYGLRDWILSWIRPEGHSVAIRLDPI